MLWRTGHQGNPKPPPCFPLTLILASSRMIRRDLVKGELLCRAGTPAEATLATAPRLTLTLTLICGACAQAVFIILEGQFAVRRDPGRGSRDSTPSGRGLSWGVEVALLGKGDLIDYVHEAPPQAAGKHHGPTYTSHVVVASASAACYSIPLKAPPSSRPPIADPDPAWRDGKAYHAVLDSKPNRSLLLHREEASPTHPDSPVNTHKPE